MSLKWGNIIKIENYFIIKIITLINKKNIVLIVKSFKLFLKNLVNNIKLFLEENPNVNLMDKDQLIEFVY